MASTSAGIIFLLGFAVSQAFRDAFFANVFQSVSFFIVILLGFGSSTLFFGLIAQRTHSIQPLFWRPAEFIALNATTALAWIAYFFALRHLEPAIVNTLYTGVGPLTVLVIGWLANTPSEQPQAGALERACYLGITLSLLALIVVSLSGRSGLERADPTASLFAFPLVLVGGALITIGHMIARRFNDLGASSSAVTSLRFLLTLLAAGVTEITFGDPAFRPDMNVLASLLFFAFILIALPSFMIQLGIARTSPLTVNVVRALGPVFVFVVQQLDDRLKFSGLTLVCVLAFCCCAVAASVLRAVSEITGPRVRLDLDPRKSSPILKLSREDHRIEQAFPGCGERQQDERTRSGEYPG